MNLHLAADELVRIRIRRGMTLRCDAGAVWITRKGDDRDHILHAGDTYRCDGRGSVVAWASEPTSLKLLFPPRGNVVWFPGGIELRPAGRCAG